MNMTTFSLLFFLLSSSPVSTGEKTSRPVPEPAPPVKELLSQIHSLSPSDLGLSKSKTGPNVWGVLMETGYSDELVTLVVLADGSTNLYLGNGGGMFGLGGFKNVRKAAKRLLAVANHHCKEFRTMDAYSYPYVGQVKFFLLTYSGRLTASGVANQLQNGDHELSDLFFAGRKVISELVSVQN